MHARSDLESFLKQGGHGYRIFAQENLHERRIIHEIAEMIGLHHESQGQRGSVSCLLACLHRRGSLALHQVSSLPAGPALSRARADGG